jgi:DnaD/phage-associated family protein
MRSISLQMACDVAVPNVFVDTYMTECIPVYALIYIYALRHVREGCTTTAIAEAFNILETDVLNAWKYWEDKGLVRLDAQGENLSITFLPVPKAEAVKNEKLEKPALSLVRDAAKPLYTVEELTVYQQQSADIAGLFTHAEKTLAKLLTYHDLSTLFGFYDWLRLPVDVILYLLDHCAGRGHRDLRYIERVALDWAERDIETIEKAAAYIQSFDKDFRNILQAFGGGSTPSPTQRKYITKWLHEWEMPENMVLEACDRAAVQIGKPKLTYVDKILEKWYKSNIRTVADACVETETLSQKPKPAEAPRKVNRYANFKQRERDYAQIERLERELMLRSIEQKNGV